MSAPRALLVATDLDATLLDHHDYSWAPAREALEALRAAEAHLCLVSSKTRAEMEHLAAELPLSTSWIVENGSALVVPEDKLLPRRRPRKPGPRLVELGPKRARLAGALPKLAHATGLALESLVALGPERLVELSGLAPEAAQRALQREYSEPFRVADAGGLDTDALTARLLAAAEALSLRVSRGGRFHHLTGVVDKGLALARLIDLVATPKAPPRVVALGDAQNDLLLLQAAERAIVVPRPDGTLEPALAALPHAERAPAPGPAGWNAAVLAVLRGDTLPPARER